ncbi:MAG TPA: fused MFS/spermidine synthase [Verrucomicrobiae bacterium]|nr:fused MFS/spermidine synthase [Verrucomicrobiae bacterium]
MTTSAPNSKSALFHALFFCSGVAGLGYQVVWGKLFALGLGHEIPSLLGVIAAFFLGMALGAWQIDSFIRKSPCPARWYGALEIILGLWGGATAFFLPALNESALRWIGPQPSTAWHWLIVFSVPAIALLPATAAMGATYPALDRFLGGIAPGKRAAGTLYAANTIGAATGVLLAAHMLMPALGFRSSLLALAGINLVCGAVALVTAPAATSPAQVGTTPSNGSPLPVRRVMFLLFLTGLLGIAYEIATVRVLAQLLENTVFTFAAVLAVYLAFSAAGAGLHERFLRQTDPARALPRLLTGTAVACATGIIALAVARPIYEIARDVTGSGVTSGVLAEILVAAAAFGFPALLMGATFSCLANSVRREEPSLGRALAWNTLGAAVAGVLLPLLGLPLLGAKWTLALGSLGYLTLAPSHFRGIIPLVTGGVIVCLAITLDLRQIDLPPGARVLEYHEGVMASVAVIETSDEHRALRVNNRFQMGGTAVALPQRRQAILPVLLHPSPKRALFLGPGTGITPGAATEFPGMQVDAVELIPEVVAAMPAFARQNHDLTRNPSARVMVADARRFARASREHYDVIVADLFHPSLDGAGALYTREHFQAVRERLNADGRFCQWLPMHQLDERSLRMITRSFLEVFPDAQAWMLHYNVDIPVIGLVGGNGDAKFPANWIEQRGSAPEAAALLRGAGLNNTLSLLGTFVAGPESLRAYVNNAPMNTDDHPRVIFSAGSQVYAAQAQPHRLFLNFLASAGSSPRFLVAGPKEGEDGHLAENLAGYIGARDLYLRGLAKEVEGQLQPAIDFYLQSSAASVFFTPAYARCVSIIQAMSRADIEGARKLFRALEAAQPAQPLGRKLLGPKLGAQPAPAPAK